MRKKTSTKAVSIVAYIEGERFIGNPVRVSADEMARETGLSEAQVQSAVEELMRKGILVPAIDPESR